MGWQAAEDRYSAASFRRCGASGLKLPPISLGLWQNFGSNDDVDTARAMLRLAFDQGVTHFDLANNYGPPYGSAETTFGKVLASDLAPYRDELIISTKAGWDMWPGPYGDGSSRKYLLASLDQSLARMGLDYVDVFYSHRRDPETPLEETVGALVHAVRQGKALYVGISSYDAPDTRRMAELLAGEGVRLLVHQPRYSLLDREIETDLLPALSDLGVGCVVFSPLAQGLLSDKHLSGPAAGSRAAGKTSLSDRLTPALRARLQGLSEIARARGQSLAQMAVAWTLRDPVVTSAIVGARTTDQLTETLRAVEGVQFSAEDIASIDSLLGGNVGA